MELEFECGLEPRPDTHSTGQHWRKAPSIRPLFQKCKTFVATAPEAQLVISGLLNVKNPGRFSQQPPLVRLNQGSSASSKRISCPQRQPRSPARLRRAPDTHQAWAATAVLRVEPAWRPAMAEYDHRRWSHPAFDLSDVVGSTLPLLRYFWDLPSSLLHFSPQ